MFKVKVYDIIILLTDHNELLMYGQIAVDGGLEWAFSVSEYKNVYDESCYSFFINVIINFQNLLSSK